MGISRLLGGPRKARGEKPLKSIFKQGFDSRGPQKSNRAYFLTPDALYIGSKGARRAPKQTFLICSRIFWLGRPKILPFWATICHSLALLDIPEAESKPPLWFCIMV